MWNDSHRCKNCTTHTGAPQTCGTHAGGTQVEGLTQVGHRWKDSYRCPIELRHPHRWDAGVRTHTGVAALPEGLGQGCGRGGEGRGCMY